MENPHMRWQLQPQSCSILFIFQVIRDRWLQDFQKGVWRCIDSKCKETFYLAPAFYKHLKECPKGEIRDLLFASNIRVTCCLCQNAFPIQRFTRHIRKHDNVCFITSQTYYFYYCSYLPIFRYLSWKTVKQCFRFFVTFGNKWGREGTWQKWLFL